MKLLESLQSNYKHTVFLRFKNSKLERNYQKSQFESALPLIRIAIVLTIIIHAAFPVLDYIVLQPNHQPVWFVRLGILLPLSIVGMFLSYLPNFSTFHQPVIALVVVINGIVWIYTTGLYGPEYALYWTIAIIEILLFALLLLRFTLFIMLSVLLVSGSIFMTVFRHFPPEILTQQIVTLIVCSNILVVGSYYIEAKSRTLFLNSIQLVEEECARHKAEESRIEWLENIALFLRHELRNSVIGIKTSIELITRQETSVNRDTYIERMQVSVGLMTHLLDSVSHANSLEASICREQSEPISLSNTLGNQVDVYRDIYSGVQFCFKHETDEIFIVANVARIVQMLDKIVTNAVEHCKEGCPISIELCNVNDIAYIIIENNGVPLNENNVAIFDLFTSFNKPLDKDNKRGMGLYIVKLIAEHYNGSVTAENLNSNEGVRVTVSFPSTTSSGDHYA